MGSTNHPSTILNGVGTTVQKDHRKHTSRDIVQCQVRTHAPMSPGSREQCSTPPYPSLLFDSFQARILFLQTPQNFSWKQKKLGCVCCLVSSRRFWNSPPMGEKWYFDFVVSFATRTQWFVGWTNDPKNHTKQTARELRQLHFFFKKYLNICQQQATTFFKAWHVTACISLKKLCIGLTQIKPARMCAHTLRFYMYNQSTWQEFTAKTMERVSQWIAEEPNGIASVTVLLCGGPRGGSRVPFQTGACVRTRALISVSAARPSMFELSESGSCLPEDRKWKTSASSPCTRLDRKTTGMILMGENLLRQQWQWRLQGDAFSGAAENAL